MVPLCNLQESDVLVFLEFETPTQLQKIDMHLTYDITIGKCVIQSEVVSLRAWATWVQFLWWHPNMPNLAFDGCYLMSSWQGAPANAK